MSELWSTPTAWPSVQFSNTLETDAQSENQEKNRFDNVASVQVAMNCLILEQIFKHFKSSYTDLRNFRQVSKLWYYETLRYWRKVAVVRLCAFEDTEEQLKTWNTADYLLAMRTDCFYQLNKYPYQKYHLFWVIFSQCQTFLSLKEENPMVTAHYRNFWNKVAKLVTHLELEGCHFSPNHEKMFDKLITEKLPNLQSLVLTKNKITPGETIMPNQLFKVSIQNARDLYQSKSRNLNLKRIKIGGDSPMDLPAMLLSAPNVNVVEFGPRFHKRNNDILEFHVTMRNAGEFRRIVDSQPFQVKTLDMMDIDFNSKPTHIAFVNFLRVTEYPLENLKLMLTNTSYAKTEDIHKMLIPVVRHFRSGLKHLTVFRPPVYKFAWKNAFPVDMPHLEELYLHGNIVNKLDFLKKMPKLKTVFIDFLCYQQDARIQEMFYRTRSAVDIENFSVLYKPYRNPRNFGKFNVSSDFQLESLERFHLNMRLPANFFSILKAHMPNLKCLETVLWKDEFQLVCKELVDLEELVLLFDSKVDDDTITGVYRVIRSPYNITRLKRLKKFEAKCICTDVERPEDDARLGDKAVYEGFLKMSNLEEVRICASSQLTKQGETALKHHVQVVKVERNYAGAMHEKGDCCRIKRFIRSTQQTF